MGGNGPSYPSYLLAVFLRVYHAGRRHLPHPLAARDPDSLRRIIDEQRERARVEDRSVRLFLEAVHDEYAMPGPRDAFVPSSDSSRASTSSPPPGALRSNASSATVPRPGAVAPFTETAF